MAQTDLVGDVAAVHEIPADRYQEVHCHRDAIRDLADAVGLLWVLHVMNQIGDQPVSAKLPQASAWIFRMISVLTPDKMSPKTVASLAQPWEGSRSVGAGSRSDPGATGLEVSLYMFTRMVCRLT